MDTRAAEIDAGVGRAVADLVADVRDTAARFETAVRDLPPAAWPAEVRTRTGELRTPTALIRTAPPATAGAPDPRVSCEDRRPRTGMASVGIRMKRCQPMKCCQPASRASTVEHGSHSGSRPVSRSATRCQAAGSVPRLVRTRPVRRVRASAASGGASVRRAALPR